MKKSNSGGSYYLDPKTNKYIYKFYTQDKKRKSVRQKKNESVKDFKKRCNTILYESYNTPYCYTSEIKFIDYLKNILDNKLKRGKIAEGTYLRNLETLKVIQKYSWSELKLEEIKPNMLQATLDDLIDIYSQSVIEKIYIMINTAFENAIKDDIIFCNPLKKCEKIKSKKQSKKVEALTIEEQKSFIQSLENFDQKTKTIFSIALYTGMRIGEILALTIDDIDFGNNFIKVNNTLTKDKDGKTILGNKTKTSSGIREIPILDNLKCILEEYVEKFYKFNFQKLLFIKDDGKLFTVSLINSKFKQVCSHANIGVKFTQIIRPKKNNKIKVINHKTSSYHVHMLRHTFATRCIEGRMQAEVLQKILGHSKITTTIDTYTSIFTKFKIEKMQELNNYFNNL